MSSNKRLKKQIRTQIEFYFSDSNLTNDKFLKQRIRENEDGYVEISVFLSFNKIKNLTSDLDLIKKAVKHSKILELSSDKTKVKRRQPFIGDVDNTPSTMFIDKLTGEYNHDTLKTLLSQFGPINLISLPRDQKTKKFKGFGFIEFNKKEDMEAALKSKTLKKKGWTLLTKSEWLTNKNEAKKRKHRVEYPKSDDGYVIGLLVEADNLPDFTFKEIHDFFFATSPPRHIEYPLTDSPNSAIITFHSPDDAMKSIQYFTNNTQESENGVITLSLLTGEVEKQKWNEINERISQTWKKRRVE